MSPMGTFKVGQYLNGHEIVKITTTIHKTPNKTIELRQVLTPTLKVLVPAAYNKRIELVRGSGYVLKKGKPRVINHYLADRLANEKLMRSASKDA